MVFATQNPVDNEGAYALPESQMDRFLMRIRMGYPDRENELDILRSDLIHYDDLSLPSVLNRQEILDLQRLAPSVFVEESVLRYLLDIVHATREEPDFKAGVSTRGALSLKLACQARALLVGREFVIPEDVLAVYEPVLTHRLSVRQQTADLLEERGFVQDRLAAIVERIPQPI